MNAHAGEFTTQSEIVPQEISSQIFHKKSDSNSQFYQQGLEITVPATANSTLKSNPITSPHCVYPALPIPPPPYQIQSGISGGGGGGGVSNSSSTAPLLGKCAMVKSNTTDSTLSNLSISSINQPQPRQRLDKYALLYCCDLFRLCTPPPPPQYVMRPQLQGSRHYIRKYYVKLRHVRLRFK